MSIPSQHTRGVAPVNQVGIEETYLNKIKAISGELTSNIILNRENLNAFPLRSGTRMPILITFIQHKLEVLAILIRPKRGIKETQIGKEEVNLFLFADNVTLYVENSKDVK